MARAPNDVSYNNDTYPYIPGIFIHYLPKDVTVWPMGRVSIVDIGEILLFNVVGLMLRIGFEDGCYERIS